MLRPTFRPRRFRPGAQVVHHPTNTSGLVVAVLPNGRRRVAFQGSPRTRMAVATVVPAKELRRGVDLIA